MTAEEWNEIITPREKIFEELLQHISYAKYDINPILNRPAKLQEIQESVKEDLLEIERLVLLLKEYE